MTEKTTRSVSPKLPSDGGPAADLIEHSVDVDHRPEHAPERPPRPPSWSNDNWAVTEAGLESRYVVNGHPIDYVVEKERLLQVEPGTNVSRWARQIAQKSWVDDPEPLVDALTEAIRHHHPEQIVVDLDATAEEVRRVWARRPHRRT